MSSDDQDFFRKLGLTKKVLAGYLGLTPQSLGQGIQSPGLYFDDKRLALFFNKAQEANQAQLLPIIESQVSDRLVFEANLNALQQAEVPTPSIEADCDYLWLVNDPERVMSELDWLQTFMRSPHTLKIALTNHKPACKANTTRRLLEPKILDWDSSGPGRIEILEQTLDHVFNLELVIPLVGEYSGQPGWVYAKHGFTELPDSTVQELAFTAYWEYLLADATEQTGLISDVPIRVIWSTISTSYLKALNLLRRFIKNPVTFERTWTQIVTLTNYQGRVMNWTQACNNEGIQPEGDPVSEASQKEQIIWFVEQLDPECRGLADKLRALGGL